MLNVNSICQYTEDYLDSLADNIGETDGCVAYTQEEYTGDVSFIRGFVDCLLEEIVEDYNPRLNSDSPDKRLTE